MSVCRLTPAAQQDLSSIWDFTEERWDIRQAATYIREIQAAIERIAADPRRGRSRTEIRQGYLSYVDSPGRTDMHAFYDHASRYLTIDVGRPAEAVDTLDVPPCASVIVNDRGAPVSIEIPGAIDEAPDALRAVAGRWPDLNYDDLLAAAHAAHAAPDRDVTVSSRIAA